MTDNINMVEIGNFLPQSITHPFIEATKWIEGDWITIRLSYISRGISKARIHVIRTDGTDKNLYIPLKQMSEMTISRIVNLLRQMVHNGVS